MKRAGLLKFEEHIERFSNTHYPPPSPSSSKPPSKWIIFRLILAPILSDFKNEVRLACLVLCRKSMVFKPGTALHSSFAQYCLTQVLEAHFLLIAFRRVSTPSMLALGKNNLIPQVVASWYDKVKVYGLQNADNRFNDPSLETFANVRTRFPARVNRIDDKNSVPMLTHPPHPIGHPFDGKNTPSHPLSSCIAILAAPSS